MNYYEALGVPRDADAATIKKAYRRMSKKHHPDRGGDARAMVLVNKAYECLSDPARREFYDLHGADKPLTSVEQLARAILFQTAIMVAANTATHTNILPVIASKLNEGIRTERANIEQMKGAKNRLSAHSKLFECDEENELQRAFTDQVSQMALGIANVEQKVAAYNAAIVLLKKYRSMVRDSGVPTNHTILHWG